MGGTTEYNFRPLRDGSFLFCWMYPETDFIERVKLLWLHHLKDGKEKQFESNVALSEAAKAISNSLGKEAVVAKVDGELTDLRDPIVDGTTVEFFTKRIRKGFSHSDILQRM